MKQEFMPENPRTLAQEPFNLREEWSGFEHVLKDDHTFATFGHGLDFSGKEQGLFHRGTRYLKKWIITVNGEPPVLLHTSPCFEKFGLLSRLINDNACATNWGTPMKQGDLQLERSVTLHRSGLFECLKLQSYSSRELCIELVYRFASEFDDLFEIRGITRKAKGTMLESGLEKNTVVLQYKGLDDKERQTSIHWDVQPESLEKEKALFKIVLPARGTTEVNTRVDIDPHRVNPEPLPFYSYVRQKISRRTQDNEDRCHLRSDNDYFNSWLDQSYHDLSLMTSLMEEGPCYIAGLPWFATLFGRDALWTSLFTMWIKPKIAFSTLKNLAALQGQELQPISDMQPGKIIHEYRAGEMAERGEVPYARYYGSIDATPLFVVSCAQYLQLTDDTDALKSFWPHIQRAMNWIETYGKLDDSGLIKYQPNSAGLLHQGWKDGTDAVLHEDGSFPCGPIALCEVQGYVFQAYLAASQIAHALEKPNEAKAYEKRAIALKTVFNDCFWWEERSTYYLGLDGNHRPIRQETSNPGHCLWTEIIPQERAAGVACSLISESLWSGWGVRTLSKHSAQYNPISYHNGAVWPHDNAILCSGLMKYGFYTEAHKIFLGQYEASLGFPEQRLPELYCGFERDRDEGPTPFPNACFPQSWAASSVFSLLSSVLGLSFDGQSNTISFNGPILPGFINKVTMLNLKVGEVGFDLSVERHGANTATIITAMQGDGRLIKKPRWSTHE